MLPKHPMQVGIVLILFVFSSVNPVRICICLSDQVISSSCIVDCRFYRIGKAQKPMPQDDKPLQSGGFS